MAYGLKPVKRRGANYETGGNAALVVADGYATAIFHGDPVTLSSGNVVVAGIPQDDGAPTTIGVFLGCEYVSPDSQLRHSHHYDGNAANTNIIAYVAADEDQLFKVESNAAFAQAQIGAQYALGAGAGGSTSTGNSSIFVDVTGGTSGTGGVVIVDIPRDGENEFSSTPDVIVKWAAGTHSGLI